MKITLIVTTYNWPHALDLTLQSVLMQKVKPYELIVADDGSNEETSNVVEKYKKLSPYKVIHSWQEDKGYRLAMSRNRAIAKSSGDYIVIIDGDMILHPMFLYDHSINAKPGTYLQGGRVLLGKSITSALLHKGDHEKKIDFFTTDIKNRKNTIRSRLLCNLFKKPTWSLRGVKGCNFSLYKNDIMLVNGFNNNFQGWGREDSEFVSRLYNSGIKRINLKFCAIAYHLYHKEKDKDSITKNDKILNETIETRKIRCDNGLIEMMNILKDESFK